MISDYRILGIEKTDDLSAIKKAYRLRVKQLHPDTADNDELIGNHFLFVEVCKAYRRLTAGAKDPEVQDRAPGPDRPKKTSSADDGARKGALVAHSDPAYAYYKNGMDIFRRIHPSEWKAREKSVIQTELGDNEEDQRLARKKVIELVSMFPRAYYFFSTVVNEYPNSMWASDSHDKMKIIEERMVRYKKIIGSFSSWKEYRDSDRKAR